MTIADIILKPTGHERKQSSGQWLGSKKTKLDQIAIKHIKRWSKK